MWVKSHFRKLYGKQLTILCHHDFWKWNCTRNIDKIIQKRKISLLSFIIYNANLSRTLLGACYLIIVLSLEPLSYVHEWIMTTSSIGIFSASLAFCAGHTLVTGEFSHKGQWRGTLIFSLICVGMNGWVKTHGAADLGRHRAYYDVIVMWIDQLTCMAQAFSRNEVHEWYGRPISNRCDPVTSYGDILLCEHWFR